MYQCNCGELFNSPEARTVHTTSCPVMIDKTPIERLLTQEEWLNIWYSGADELHLKFWNSDYMTSTLIRQDAKSFEVGIEKGRQMERERIIAAASFTVRLEKGIVIVNEQDWDRLWQTIKGGKE